MEKNDRKEKEIKVGKKIKDRKLKHARRMERNNMNGETAVKKKEKKKSIIFSRPSCKPKKKFLGT
jgi:hypothetical protein